MTEVEQIWRAKSDGALLVAAAELNSYEDEGKRAIREELRRRGFEDPVEQSRFAAPDAEFAQPDEGDAQAGDADAPPPAPPRCLRCEVAERYLGARWFRQGANEGALAARGPKFEIDQSFDVYVCPECGHVDLFVAGAGTAAPPD
jgi:hypothetical protein